jgi:diguanylate cyclase (GGDEF)-like protein
VNDTLGHNTGDLLLKASVWRIKSLIRMDDIFARIGGDEFVIILTDIQQEKISTITKKILHSIREPFMIKDHKINVSVSIGISTYPEDGLTLKTLLKSADIAMYKTKELGKDNFTYYSALQTS